MGHMSNIRQESLSQFHVNTSTYMDTLNVGFFVINFKLTKGKSMTP